MFGFLYQMLVWTVILAVVVKLLVRQFRAWRAAKAAETQREEKRLGDWADILHRIGALGSGRHAYGTSVWQLPGIEKHRVYRAGPSHAAVS